MQATQGGKDRKVRGLRSWNPGREVESKTLGDKGRRAGGGGTSAIKRRGRWGPGKTKLLVRLQSWATRTKAKIVKTKDYVKPIRSKRSAILIKIGG